MVLLSLPAMCRVYHSISDEEEIESHQQSEYNYYRHWETESVNDLEHSALNSDKRGLIWDNYSQRSSVAITGDNSLSGKLPAMPRTQLRPENDHNDDHKTPEDESDDVCDQELAHNTSISQDNAMNDASDLKGLYNETKHLDKRLERVRTDNDEERKSRIFSIFSLVRFKNEACTPSGTKNTYLGTCYLATECAERVRGMKIHSMTQYTHNMNCLSLKHVPWVRNQGDCVLVDGI